MQQVTLVFLQVSYIWAVGTGNISPAAAIDSDWSASAVLQMGNREVKNEIK